MEHTDKNIVFDFTLVGKNQPVALMPAKLAQTLLVSYVEKLRVAKAQEITGKFVKELEDFRDEDPTNLEGFNEVVYNYLNERELVDNIAKGNWMAYEVKQ